VNQALANKTALAAQVAAPWKLPGMPMELKNLRTLSWPPEVSAPEPMRVNPAPCIAVIKISLSANPLTLLACKMATKKLAEISNKVALTPYHSKFHRDSGAVSFVEPSPDIAVSSVMDSPTVNGVPSLLL
jgi:hypothetical protein